MDNLKQVAGARFRRGREAVIYVVLNVAVVLTGLLFWIAEPTSRTGLLLSMPFAVIAANLAAWVGFRYRTRVVATDGDGQRPGKKLLLLGAFLCLIGLVSAKWAFDRPVDIISGVMAVMFLLNGIVLIAYSFRRRA